MRNANDQQDGPGVIPIAPGATFAPPCRVVGEESFSEGRRTADAGVECSHEGVGTDLVEGFRPGDPEPRCTTAYHYVPDKNRSSGTSANRAMTGSSRI